MHQSLNLLRLHIFKLWMFSKLDVVQFWSGNKLDGQVDRVRDSLKVDRFGKNSPEEFLFYLPIAA